MFVTANPFTDLAEIWHNLGNQKYLFLMLHRLILKVTKFQLLPLKRLSTVVNDIFFLGGGGGRLSNRVKRFLAKELYHLN